MQYTSVKIAVPNPSEENTGILVALLDSLKYEGIAEQGNNVIAYIATGLFDRDILELTLAGVKGLLHAEIVSEEILAEKNWNEVWESNFEPVIIDNRCIIKAPFHRVPGNFEYTIIIEPKMSFGTGHHETTSLMVSAMLDIDFKNKKVLDMGCGTGVLGIFATIKGAEEVVGIDIDKWSYENAIENAAKNKAKIQVYIGREDVIPPKEFDIILANINRNVLIEQALDYTNHLAATGRLFLSGFLQDDIDMIEATFVDLGLTPVNHTSMGRWQMLEFVK